MTAQNETENPMILRRLVGFLFIIAAAAGMLFGILGLLTIWRFRPVVTRAVTDNLALVDQALSTTQDGLNMVGQVVQTTAAEVTSLQTTIQSLAQAIHDTNPMLDSLMSLTKNDFPTAISATKSSLAAAQSSALIIDNVLTALTSFSPVAIYKPNVPLHTALAQVSTSLDTLPTSLSTITTSLATGKTNLGALELKINDISATTQGISTTLGSAQSVIDQYIAVTTQLKAQVEAIQRTARAWITAIAWILSFVLVWLLIAQLGLGMQGLEMLRGHPRLK
jgi:septal ring factor EnvC (AmiA/AmiB activator)